jgi:hypothetical protein
MCAPSTKGQDQVRSSVHPPQCFNAVQPYAATKRTTFEKQASLERQLREVNPPRSLRNKLAGTLHHFAERLAPEYDYLPRTSAA